ncbi:MAG: hypothetical protein JRJ58_21910 [Deltaproteobacteria bacterium]|nr:hypothetical protein [Deltaproteobacteria bacterium]
MSDDVDATAAHVLVEFALQRECVLLDRAAAAVVECLLVAMAAHPQVGLTRQEARSVGRQIVDEHHSA